MIAYFLCNIFAKYYENPTMLSRVIAKNIGDVFLRHSVVTVDYLLFCSIHSSKYDERQAVSDQRERRSAVVSDPIGVLRRIYQVPVCRQSASSRYLGNRRHCRLTHAASATHSRNEELNYSFSMWPSF